MRLCGNREIADLVKCSPQMANYWIGRQDFPEPVAHLAQGRIWDRDQVEAWISKNSQRLNNRA